MARTLELDTIQTPSANNANIQLGSDTVTFSSNIAVDINNATIDGATINTSDITVGPGKTLDVQNGTLTTSATQKKAIIEGAGADVDLGAHEVRAETFQSDVATGTAPLTVASTTKVTNLNADKLDDYNSSDLFNLDHAQVSGVLDVDHGGTNVSTLAGQAQGTNPETYRRKFFRGSNTNTATAPAFGQIDSADLPVYVGATSSAVGVPGAVPSATIAKKDQFLKGDGTYATPTDTNTVTSVGTSSSNRTSGNIDIVGGTNVTTSKSGSTITIASTDTDTVTSVGTSSSNRTSGNIDIVGGTNVTTTKSGGTITINSSSVPTGTLVYSFRKEWDSGAFSSTPRAYAPYNNTGSFKYYNITDSIDLLTSGTSQTVHVHFHMHGEIEQDGGGQNPAAKFYIVVGTVPITGSTTAYSNLGDTDGGGTNGSIGGSLFGTFYGFSADKGTADNYINFHHSGSYRTTVYSNSYRYIYVVCGMNDGNSVYVNAKDTHIMVYTET